MALEQFRNLSSWREQTVEIKAGEVEVVIFRDTKPNLFYIQNPQDARLRVAMGRYPTSKSYEFTVDPNSTCTLGRPTATGYLYILNDDTITATVTIYSIFEEKFDMNILKNISVVAENATFVSEGIVKGWKEGVTLPSGDNVIGQVKVVNENFADILNNIKNVKNTGDATNSKLLDIINLLGVADENTLLALINNMLNNITGLRDTMNAIRNTINVPNGITPVYLNNVVEFSFSASRACKVHFGWFFNDGKMGHFKVGNAYKLTVFETEQFTDFEIELQAGETLTFECEEPIFRCKYWVV